MHFSDALPCRASDFPLSTKRIYIYKVARHVEKMTPKIRRRGMEGSAESIWSFTYSFKKIIRLHFPRSRLRDPSKISSIPLGKSMVFARGNLSAEGQKH